MPNSFTVFPNVLPGNVTIGGNLTVSGDQLRIGAAAPFVRVGKDSSALLVLSQNLGFDENTQDSAGSQSWGIMSHVGGVPDGIRRKNTAGTVQDTSLGYPVFVDYTLHNHTGTTTEDTIYSKTIPANTLGANGALRVRVFLTFSVQGAGTTTFRIKFGGITVLSFTVTNNTDARMIEAELINQNSASVQIEYGYMLDISTGAIQGAQGTSNVNTAADATLAVTVQSSATTDSQNFQEGYAAQLNSFGPV